MTHLKRYGLVLAIYPNSRGFAFAAFESALSPFDWGVKEVRGAAKNRQCKAFIAALLERLDPVAVVLQDMSSNGTRRAKRMRELNIDITQLATRQTIPVFSYSRAYVRQTFGGSSTTKEAIARAIARHVPAFERYLPPARKAWMSEDARMGLFDATALAIAFFRQSSSPEP